MNKTPITFNLPNLYTLEKHSFNTINIKIIKYKRSIFTIILGYIADRLKLPPVIIFKLKNIS